MITDAIVHFLAAAIVGLLGWLPETGPTDGISSVIIGAVDWVKAANGWFPVVSVAGAVLFVVFPDIALKLWDLVVWVYHQFWGSD